MTSKTKQIYIAFQSIVRREIIRFLRIWAQTLLPSAITMALYFMIFGNLIGARIGNIHEFTYHDCTRSAVHSGFDPCYFQNCTQ